MGQTVDTLTLVSWYKQEGETVAQGEPLYAVETDKATLDVEAPATGVLRGVKAKPGDVVKVLSAIAVIEAEAKQGSTSTLILTSTSRRFVSPRARRLAESEGIDLAEVNATGPEGAIVERDVRAYLQGSGIRDQGSGDTSQESAVTRGTRQPAGGISPVARGSRTRLDWTGEAIAGTGPRGQITKEDVEAAIEQRSRGVEEQGSGGVGNTQDSIPNTQYPLSGIRALIAERMVAGHSRTAPVTLTAETDAHPLVELRQKLAADGVAVSYNDLFLAILAKALGEHPRLNASLDGDLVKLWPQMDIAVAVDTERGLLAPVVRGVDRKGLAQLAAEIVALAERARAGKCAPDEAERQHLHADQPGHVRHRRVTPIINLPECAILGVGRIKTQPVWAGDHVEPREMVWLSLTFDHRLVDGGPAARFFLQRVMSLWRGRICCSRSA